MSIKFQVIFLINKNFKFIYHSNVGQNGHDPGSEAHPLYISLIM